MHFLHWRNNAWSQTNEVRYMYDGNLVMQERDANNLPLVTYTRGRDLRGTLQGAGGIGGLLARTDHRLLAIGDPGSHAYYHGDGNGNVTALINTNQLIVAKYLYDPFGNVLSMSGPLADGNLYRFSSKEFHANSGMHYYGYRFYDPSLQRWANRDPIGELGGLNLYGYVDNIPINKVDSYGRNAYVVNAGGYGGHTSFVVDSPTGGVVAYHFFAEHHGGDAPWYKQDMGLFYDGVHIWPQYAESLEDYLGNEGKIYGGLSVLGVAVGTQDDDAAAIQRMQQEIDDQEGYYSLLEGSECHRHSWDWFYDYSWGGRDVSTAQIQGLTLPVINGQLISPPDHFTLTPAFSMPQFPWFGQRGIK